MEDQIMSIVPRVSGLEVHPCMGSAHMVVLDLSTKSWGIGGRLNGKPGSMNDKRIKPRTTKD
jgi:hypothetical protein